MKKVMGLSVFWVLFMIFTEKVTLERMLIGSVVCMGVYILNKPYLEEDKDIPFKMKHFYYYFMYTITLIKEIIVANIEVAKVVLSKDMNISPKVIQFRCSLKKEMHKVILANSITLTPGTLTVDVKEDLFTVHCLKEKYIKDVMNSKFEQILLKIEE